MESSVQFKVFFDGEVRRFPVDISVSDNFEYLVEKLVSVFPDRLRRAAFNVSWTDEDGDDVSVKNDEELKIALEAMKGPVYKLTVHVVKDKKPAEGQGQGQVHDNVVCDGCEGKVVGFRYKCVVCPDYDLCGGCEAKAVHPGHNMMRIATPEAAFPTHFFKRINKMHERIHKRAAADAAKAHEEAHNGSGNGNGFYNPEMDPFLNGGAWVHGMNRGRFGCGRGRARGRFGNGAGGPRVWDAMMNGWRGTNEAKPENKAENENKANEDRQQQQQQAEASFENLANGFLGEGGADYLKNIGKMVAEALDPLGVDVQVDVEHGGKRTNMSKPKEAAPEKAEEAKEEPKKAEEEPKKAAEEEPKTKSGSSTPNSEVDEGEWTVLNSETGAKPKTPTVNIPVNVEVPINKAEDKKTENDKDDETVEVPIQVSDKPAKVLFAGKDGTIYPELPKEEASKVVEEEKKVEENKAEPTAPTFEIASHPDPRIQVALQAMINMGFTNEGNWLSQLLEAKNGDIGKALDVLQPVKK